MSLSGPVKAGGAVLGGAALLGWGTAVYLWIQPKSETLTAAETIAEVKGNAEGNQDIASHMELLKAEISRADIDLEAKGRTLKNREQRIAEAERNLAEVKSEIEASRGQLGEVTGRIDQGKATIDQHELTVTALRQDQISVEEAIAKARVELDEVTSTIDAKHSTDQEIDFDPKDHL